MMNAIAPEAALGDTGAIIETFTPPRTRGTSVGKGTIRLLSVAEALDAPARTYLLAGLIAPGELSVWWGAPKCGKSFLLLRIAYCLARGLDVFGRKVRRPVRVIYVAAEGESGIGGRLRALHAEFGDAGDNLVIIAQRVVVGGRGDHMDDLVVAIHAHRAELVVIDTLARTFGEGDENTAQDMGRYIAQIDRLREAGAHVAVIHHGSKDENATTPRGSVALLAAADLVVKVRKGADGAASTATVEHAKDDADGAVMGFRLRVAELGTHENGSRWSTCIAVEAEASGARHDPRTTRMTETQRGWLSDISAVFAEGKGAVKSPVPGMAETVTLTREQLRAGLRVRGRFVADPHAPLTALDRRRFTDALNALKSKGKLGLTEDLVWLT